MSTKAVRSPLQAVLRATLCEIERGVFYVTYPDMDIAAGLSDLSTYQVGSCAAEARQQVEHSAHALGYETVVWNDANIAPLFPMDPLQHLAQPASAYVARYGV